MKKQMTPLLSDFELDTAARDTNSRHPMISRELYEMERDHRLRIIKNEFTQSPTTKTTKVHAETIDDD